MLCKGITVSVEISMTKDSSEGGQNATLNLSGKQILSWGKAKRMEARRQRRVCKDSESRN